MSCDLSIKITEKMNKNKLILGINDTLKKLLSINNVPEVYLYTNINGEKEIFDDNIIGLVGQCFYVGLKGYEDGISIIITEVPLQLPYVTEEEAGIWSGLSVGLKKSPIEFTVAAAAAITIAKEQATDIIDDACVWSNNFKMQPLEFFNMLTVKSNQGNVLEASNKVMEKLKI